MIKAVDAKHPDYRQVSYNLLKTGLQCRLRKEIVQAHSRQHESEEAKANAKANATVLSQLQHKVRSGYVIQHLQHSSVVQSSEASH